jgi:hypothetical protein
MYKSMVWCSIVCSIQARQVQSQSATTMPAAWGYGMMRGLSRRMRQTELEVAAESVESCGQTALYSPVNFSIDR